MIPSPNDIENTSQQACSISQANTPLLVTVEVTRQGSRSHGVNIAVLDAEAGAWVSGIAFSWRGRLQSQELRALAQPSYNAHVGSHAKPIAGRNIAQLDATLFQQAKCQLPNGVDGSVFVATNALSQQVNQQTPGQQSLNLAGAVTPELIQLLAASPGWVFNPQVQQARWQLEVTWLQQAALHQLVVRLTPINPAGAVQRLASVYVEPMQPNQPFVAPKLSPPAVVPTPKPAVEQELLSALRPDEGYADCKAGHRCVDIHFDLHRSGHVLVFQTLEGRVNSLTCQRRPNLHRDAGPQTYRLNLQPNQLHQRVGFYVIGTHSLQTARQLAYQLRSAPGNCGSKETNADQWLQQTITLLRSSDEKLEWQALHMQLTPNGFAVL